MTLATLLILFVSLFVTGAALFLLQRQTGRIRFLKEAMEEKKGQLEKKNKLLSTLTHELKTPLSVIKTSLDLLREERPGPLREQQTLLVESAGDNVQRLIRFSNSILAAVKIDSSGFRLNKRPVDLRVIIPKICRELKPWLGTKNINIRYTCPNFLRKIPLDPDWIGQVLINLIHNAGKHQSRGGRIDVSVTDNDSCLVVTVADNGSGIGSVEKPHIFEEFFQGMNEGRLDGAGLGLTIVKSVIELHGGKVYVSSVENLGTTLSFTLPRENPNEELGYGE